MNFKDLNTVALDKDLPEAQKAEWNAIYASYRSRSILTGTVIGMDMVPMAAGEGQTDDSERVIINCLVIIAHRVKVLIPEQEMWFDDESKRPAHVLRSMVGANLDYVITGIDRLGECCLASRRTAMEVRRRQYTAKKPRKGDVVDVRVLAAGRTRLLVEYMGYDVSMVQRDLSYAMLPDLRRQYHPGATLKAKYNGYSADSKTPLLSVKESEPHPFIGADIRHPAGCRRGSVITGKYKGGVFCKLENNLDVLCTYAQNQFDGDFHIDDQVIIAIVKHDYGRNMIYGKIVAKW